MMDSMKSFDFQTLSSKDIHQITRLHLKSLPDDILSKLPEHVLNRTVFKNLVKDKNISIGAFNPDSQLVAYIIFSPDGDILHNLIKNDFFAFLVMLLRGIFLRPFQLKFYFGIFKAVLAKFNTDGYELCYIGVDPEYQGCGLGSMIIKNAYESYPVLNKIRIWVKTLESTPQNVEFYKKNNFSIFKIHNGRIYLERLK